MRLSSRSVRPSIRWLVTCPCPNGLVTKNTAPALPHAIWVGSYVFSLVIRCALSSCICSSVFLCLIMIKNSQIGNTGIRHNRKKTASPLRSVIAGFHCTTLAHPHYRSYPPSLLPLSNRKRFLISRVPGFSENLNCLFRILFSIFL